MNDKMIMYLELMVAIIGSIMLFIAFGFLSAIIYVFYGKLACILSTLLMGIIMYVIFKYF